ncbi:MAG TPA: putative toxin-antitoxin system toxin component, PIN family [Chloroflexota bacterium]|nr:putative toxin-antitoxin system toxin component, PIN family [Chloroflexota bacterium]
MRRDPDDDHVLATAITGNAAYIVSRDRDLLTLGVYESVPIMEPAAALKAIRAELQE